MTTVQQQPYHHGNLRQALLDEAFSELEQQGVDKLSLRALARAVGVSQTAPYRHFPDKNCLLATLAQQGFERLTQVLTRACQGETSATAKLQRAGRAYIRFAQQHPQLYRLMFSARPFDPHDYPALMAAGDACFGVVRTLAEAGVANGEFVALPVEVLASTAWALVHGQASLILDGRYDCVEVGELEQVIELSIQTLMQGIARRG